MGNTRTLFKKIGDTKGTFHAKMGIIKDRNWMDLKEEEDIEKMWQEYTEELYNKHLHDPDNHDGVGLSYIAFIMLRYIPSMSSFWRVFIINEC